MKTTDLIPLECANAVLNNLPLRWLSGMNWQIRNVDFDRTAWGLRVREGESPEQILYDLWRTCCRQRRVSRCLFHASAEFALLWEFQKAAVFFESVEVPISEIVVGLAALREHGLQEAVR